MKYRELLSSGEKTLKSFDMTASEFITLLDIGDQCSGLDEKVKFSCNDIKCIDCPIHSSKKLEDITYWLTKPSKNKFPLLPKCKPPAPTKHFIEERIEKLEEQNTKIINMLEQILGIKEIE